MNDDILHLKSEDPEWESKVIYGDNYRHYIKSTRRRNRFILLNRVLSYVLAIVFGMWLQRRL